MTSAACIKTVSCLMGILGSTKPMVPTSVCHWSAKYGIDPKMVLSVIKTETNFRHITKPNSTHDVGIMQIHCPSRKYASWCRWPLKKLDWNIKAGVYIMSLYKSVCDEAVHQHHYIRHYNWNNRKHAKRVLFWNKLLTERQGECNAQ